MALKHGAAQKGWLKCRLPVGEEREGVLELCSVGNGDPLKVLRQRITSVGPCKKDVSGGPEENG